MGGGVIGTAAKAAVSGAFRSPLLNVLRRSARKQVSSFAPAVEPELFGPSLSAGHERTEVPAVSVAANWPEFEISEWELAGGKDKHVESTNTAPRLIFGPVPTLEEAEQATTDLKDTLEKVYFTPQHTLKSNYEVCQEIDSGECSTVSSVPNHVIQMHSLLQTREVQDIVVSLASDKSVWDAVMNNPKVVQFCENPSPAFAEMHQEPVEFVAENVEGKETSGSSILNTIKLKVSQMVSSITNFIKDFFGSSTSDATDNTDTMRRAVVAAVIGAILLIVVKRM